MSYAVYYSVLFNGAETPDTVNLPGSYQAVPADYPAASNVELDWSPPLQSWLATYWSSRTSIHFRWSFSTRYWSEDTYGEFYFEHLPLVGLMTARFNWGSDDGVAGTLLYTFDPTAYPWYVINTTDFSNEDTFSEVDYIYPGTQHIRIEGEQSLWEQFCYMRFFGPAIPIPPAPPIPGGITQLGGAEGAVTGNAAIWQV